jgi:dynactin 1
LKKLEEYRIAIEDLEALKDLNDELEENHVETEKQLQEEIGRSAPSSRPNRRV